MSASVWNPTAGTIGLSNLSRLSQEFTASAGQTNFVLVITPFTVGSQNLEVFKNGAKLLPSLVTELTAGTSFSIAACTLGDKIEAVVFPATSASFDSLAAQAQASATAARVSELAAAASAASISQYTGAAIGGNLTFLGSGQRIVGDFSNATISNRLMFQTSTVNGATVVAAIPNGTNTISQWRAYNGTDPDNAGWIGFVSSTASMQLQASITGAGTYLPMTFYTGGAERLRVGTSGELGIGGANYGTAGQVLISGGPSAAPTWATSIVSKQIQPISASVASNAITISASTLSLDFRSTALTSGTVAAVSGTPANLVIAATDSFGLTTVFGKQRIAILALNNAGTIELAASALYGGLALDETGVITTSAAATLATHIKSTTARTGLAYRVIGFVEATFTTAVGWGSLVVVQGQGGQALASMTSLGYGRKTNVVGSRAIGTTYYNTTGRPLYVAVYGTGGAAVGLSMSVSSLIVSSGTMGNVDFSACVSGIVGPGESYLINQWGAVTLFSWIESN